MRSAIQSDAFQRAALRSERYRIVAFLVLFASLICIALTSGIVERAHANRFELYVAFWIFGAGYESLMLWLVRRTERAGRKIPAWRWVVNTIVECSLPTLALLGLTSDKSYVGPYLALVSPALIIYFLLIILSTLRLSPALCLLAGVVSGSGYALVYLLTLWWAPENPNRHVLPQRIFILYPLLITGAGVVAAAVAWQIRSHVLAALHEAETRRKLDRIEHDLQTARSIQMGLLPKGPPVIAGYEIAGWSQPADQTGGDYYDWIELGDGRVLFVIADATGHGIGPALLVAACRAYFRAMATKNDPINLMTSQVDQLLSQDVGDGRFITAAIALLDPQAHRLSVYSAGHAPLYFYQASTDSVSAMDADQPPLGIGMPEPDPSEASRMRIINLAVGDAFVLVTDGLFECSDSSGKQLGTKGLADLIQRHKGAAAQELIARIREDVLAHTRGVEQADDQTAVAIQRIAV